ncbi:hypothetical protein EIM50_19535 [Pseudoxanthomonas sp. SGD-10]|nr:hypothetical protein EIM50_19535 [Pseudoxanthomonas sp. SGD-10]
MGTLDECKPVDNNTKLLLTSSNSGGILLLDIATKTPLFYAGGQNAHSADLLPNNKIVAALSTGEAGNKVVVHDINRPDEIIFQDNLLGGHGIVWIPERNRVYALGSREIIEYSLVNWASTTPQLKRERSWNVPGNSGHDLSRVNKDKLLITSNYTYALDLNEGTFTTFSALQNITNVKSVNYFENTGWLVYTRGENGEYWSNNVHMKNPAKTVTIPGYRIYKARLMENK